MKNTDNDLKPKAVVNLLADWSKAFNNVNHNIVMRILIFLGVPQWILRLILSYLESRKMIVRFRGCQSTSHDIPGSAPQGTLLGVFLYILYINPICFPGEVTLQVHDILTKYWQEFEVPNEPQVKYEVQQVDNVEWLVPKMETDIELPEMMNAVKFMDDATCQEVVDITTCLATNIDRSGPLPFWESSGKVLPPENSLL